MLTVKAGLEMETIDIFDITGRKIFTSGTNNAKNFTTPFNQAQAVYIVKVKLSNGKIATIKLVNPN